MNWWRRGPTFKNQQPGGLISEQGLKSVGVWEGARTLLTVLSGSWDNKSIDCPSPVGAKCKQIEKDRGQSRSVRETDILDGGPAFVDVSPQSRPVLQH